ncbi:MAG: hypothetical protein ACOYXM_09000 [Actinomycetota bacterium]
MALAGIAISPAEAAVATNGCKNSVIPGAEIGHYPAQPASQSGLRVSCNFRNDTGNNMVTGTFTIHDFDVAMYHNGAARTITNTASIASGATTFTATNFAGATGFVNRVITQVGGTGIPARTFVKSISGAGLVTLSNPTVAVIPAGTSFKIDNGHSRSRTDVVTTAASTTITSATANFTAADVGLSVGGTFIAADTTIASVTNSTTVVLTNAATASGASQTVTFGGSLLNTTTRTVNNAAITSATVINSSAAKWKTDDVGLPVYGPGIPANTYILSVSGANATTTGGMTVNAGPLNVTIGDPSVTAPTSADTIANQGVQLNLNPVLVAGSDACFNNTTEGFTTVATWRNPGSFAGTGSFNTQPAGTKAIGQIFFDTSVADFSAFVIERPLLVAGDPIGSTHYDLVLNSPTSLALCPSSATSTGLGFSLGVHASTASQAQLAPGVGKPGTAQFRSILPQAGAGYPGYASTAYVASDDPLITFAPAAEFNRLCLYPAGSANVNFQCGNG